VSGSRIVKPTVKKRAEKSTAGRPWAARLTVYLVAVAGLLMASGLPLGVGPPPGRDKAKVAEVAPAAYHAPDLAKAEAAANDNAPLDEKPSFISRFLKQLRSAMGGAMVGLAVALGLPPQDVFRDRTEDPCEVVPGEEIDEEVDYIYVDDGEGAMGGKTLGGRKS
jgi:hypothetical protein